jgi:hypothetical protein
MVRAIEHDRGRVQGARRPFADEHGARSVSHDGKRDATEKESGDGAEAAGSHRNKIGVPVACSSDLRLASVVRDQGDRWYDRRE